MNSLSLFLLDQCIVFGNEMEWFEGGASRQ